MGWNNYPIVQDSAQVDWAQLGTASVLHSVSWVRCWFVPTGMLAGGWLVPDGVGHMFRASISMCWLILTGPIGLLQKVTESKREEQQLQDLKRHSLKVKQHHFHLVPLIRTSHKAWPVIKGWKDKSCLFYRRNCRKFWPFLTHYAIIIFHSWVVELFG